jgi:hypothetical protein
VDQKRYLENAARCVAEAERLSDDVLRRGLLAMAEAWLQFLEQKRTAKAASRAQPVLH